MFIAPIDEGARLPDVSVTEQAVTTLLDDPESAVPSEMSPYARVLSGQLAGELVEIHFSADRAFIVVDASAEAAAHIAWKVRELSDGLQVYDEAYTVAIPLAELSSADELAAQLSA